MNTVFKINLKEESELRLEYKERVVDEKLLGNRKVQEIHLESNLQTTKERRSERARILLSLELGPVSLSCLKR